MLRLLVVTTRLRGTRDRVSSRKSTDANGLPPRVASATPTRAVEGLPVLRRLLLLSVVVAVTAVPASALAIEPEQQLAGASSKWFSGELGLADRPELLDRDPRRPVHGDHGPGPVGIRRRGERRTADRGSRLLDGLHDQCPGEPVRAGVLARRDDLILPDNTVVDTARGIRCFGLPRNHSGWEDITNQSWSLEEVGSGPYCPTSALPSIYQSNALSFSSA